MRHRETRVASHEYAVLRVGKGRVRASLCDAPVVNLDVIDVVNEKSLVNWPARLGHQRLVKRELAAALTRRDILLAGTFIFDDDRTAAWL